MEEVPEKMNEIVKEANHIAVTQVLEKIKYEDVDNSMINENSAIVNEECKEFEISDSLQRKVCEVVENIDMSKKDDKDDKSIEHHDKDEALSLLDLVEKQSGIVQRVSSDSNLSTDNTCVEKVKDLGHKSNFVSFDSSTDSYQENARTSSSQSCPINDIESKFLEEQANLKRQLEESQSKCCELLESIAKKDETISMLQSTRNLLEKEKQTLKREVEISTKEKENAVIRYATVEKSNLDARTAKDTAEKKMRDALKDAESANTRMKLAVAEKTRVTGLFDTKCQELRLSQREIERLKGDLSSLETKLKWNTTKLKTETELKVVAEKKLEELTEEVNKLKLSEISRAKDEVENEKALVTEKQFMEQQATLILLKHGNEEKERKIEILEKKLATSSGDVTDLNAKVRQYTAENERLSTENTQQKREIDELQLQLDKEVIKVAELQAKVNEIESLRTQLTLAKNETSRLKQDFDSLNTNYDELGQEIEKIRGKETELLQFNSELAERYSKLQNECSLLNSKLLAIDLENKNIKKDKKYYDDIIEGLQKEFDTEKQQRADERILMTKHISEKTRLSETLQKQLDLVNGDMQALKKKQAQSSKELNREITQLRKKLDQIETTKPIANLNAGSESETEKDQSHSKSDISNSDSDSVQTHNDNSNNTLNFGEPSKKHLIERILKLQHATARQAEKIDFLENHAATLVAEVQKKSKLIQNFMLREQSGALSSSKSDKNKHELAKYGGIMAAVYGGAVVKNTTNEMTLELSLEINRKLQALLEDTILKNITLKENVDTLGLEVDVLMKKLAPK